MLFKVIYWIPKAQQHPDIIGRSSSRCFTPPTETPKDWRRPWLFQWPSRPGKSTKNRQKFWENSSIFWWVGDPACLGCTKNLKTLDSLENFRCGKHVWFLYWIAWIAILLYRMLECHCLSAFWYLGLLSWLCSTTLSTMCQIDLLHLWYPNYLICTNHVHSPKLR